MKRNKTIAAAVCLLAFMMLLTGCGRSLVINTGFRRNELFKIGSSGCRTAEVRVYILDLQKEHEALYGNSIWDGEDRETLQEAVKEQALAEIIHVKALNRIGVSRNVMLTTREERLAEEAEHNYYSLLSGEEQKYLDLDEKNLQRMFREYALAEKTWRSLGEDAEKVYDEFMEKTQCDLNTALWQKVSLKKLEGELAAPGFIKCYRALFTGEEGMEEAAGGSTAEEAADQNPENAESAPAEDGSAPAQAPAAEPAETPAAEPAAPAETPAAEPAPAESAETPAAEPAAPAETPAAEPAPAESAEKSAAEPAAPAETPAAEPAPAESAEKPAAGA